MKPLIFRREAQTEFDPVADWYEARRPGLGVKFIAEVRRVFEAIATHPDVDEGIREALLHRFPYAIDFVENPRQIDILSVFHTARHPACWKSRR